MRLGNVLLLNLGRLSRELTSTGRCAQARLASRREHVEQHGVQHIDSGLANDATKKRELQSFEPKSTSQTPPGSLNSSERVLGPVEFTKTPDLARDGKEPPKYELVLARLNEDVSWCPPPPPPLPTDPLPHALFLKGHAPLATRCRPYNLSREVSLPLALPT